MISAIWLSKDVKFKSSLKLSVDTTVCFAMATGTILRFCAGNYIFFYCTDSTELQPKIDKRHNSDVSSSQSSLKNWSST